jgi:superfamily I DNA/RNA helicase
VTFSQWKNLIKEVLEKDLKDLDGINEKQINLGRIRSGNSSKKLIKIEEKNRMAYVAFSRAKYLLALGIPKPSSFSDSDKKRLMDYGFKLIEV